MNNVLVVDSDQNMLQILSGILKGQGGLLNVLTAKSTRQATKILKKNRIALVITTIRLPKLDGFRLATKLTREYPSTKLIILTNTGHPLLRATVKRFPAAVHFDQAHDISMLSKRVFSELQIDYGGCLRGISLSSFLQMLELEKCSCCLRVSSKNQVGFLWLKNGELIAAKSPDKEGRQAALDIIAWNNTFVDIDYAPYEMKRQIAMPLMMLIIESGRHLDEKRSDTTEYRKDERYDLLVTIDYDITNMTRQCSLLDISSGGAYIVTDHDIELGQDITLNLTAPTLKGSCSINADVIRIDSSGAGLRFQIGSPEQEQMISAMINSSMKSRYRREQSRRTTSRVM